MRIVCEQCRVRFRVRTKLIDDVSKLDVPQKIERYFLIRFGTLKMDSQRLMTNKEIQDMMTELSKLQHEKK